MKWQVDNISVETGLRITPEITAELRGYPDVNAAWLSLDKIHKNLQGLLDSGSTQPLTVKKCIFNGPATIIIWSDNTKTIVKCRKDATYDREKAFMAAYMKKLFGNSNGFKKEIKRWVK